MSRLTPLLLCLMVAGCDQSMTVQSKYNTETRADIWPDGTSARPLPENVVARGEAAREAAVFHPPPVSASALISTARPATASAAWGMA